MVSSGSLKLFPISRLFPNMVTLLGLCAGLSAIRFALNERWELAVTFIVIAAFIDGLDGRLARLLKSTSKFGAELDSLSDFVNFGVTPALIVYLWRVDELHIRGLGWGLTLLLIICMVIRLARFNTMTEDVHRPYWADRFFTGVPAPAGAGLLLIPMMLSFQIGEGVWTHPGFVAIYMSVIALLLVSTLPTFSGKKIRIRHEFASLAMLVAGVVFIALFMEPWITLPLMGLVYVLSFPFSVWYYLHLKQKNPAEYPIEEENGQDDL